MNQYGSFHETYKSPYDATDGGSASPIVYDIDGKESFQKIVDLFPIVVVDVWAPYCNPCKMMAVKYENVAKMFQKQHENHQIIFMKDNIEQHDDIHKPHVTVVPTFFMYVHGKRFHIPDFREMQVTIESALSDVLQQQYAQQQQQMQAQPPPPPSTR